MELDPLMTRAEWANYTRRGLRSVAADLRHPTKPLPSYKVGARVLIRLSEGLQWLEQFKVKPAVALPATEQAREMLATMQNKEPLRHRGRKSAAGAVGCAKVRD
jgi:hypothetical protein